MSNTALLLALRGSAWGAILSFGVAFVFTGVILNLVSVLALEWWDRAHSGTRGAALLEGFVAVALLSMVCAASYAGGIAVAGRLNRIAPTPAASACAGIVSFAAIWLLGWVSRDAVGPLVRAAGVAWSIVGPAIIALTVGSIMRPSAGAA